MSDLLDKIIKDNPKMTFITADGLDDAVIGFTTEGGLPQLAYSKEKCTVVLMKRDGMGRDEAEEFLEFNTYQAFAGPQTPIFTEINKDVTFNI